MGNRPYVWNEGEESHDYDDIMDLPHYRSRRRPHMSPVDRAAQFSPYDALTGYSEEIDETRRLTEEREELYEYEREELNARTEILSRLCERAARDRRMGREYAYPEAEITYFVPDGALHRGSRKTGGAFLTLRGKVKRIDPAAGTILFERNGEGKTPSVKFTDILTLRSPEIEEYRQRLGAEDPG